MRGAGSSLFVGQQVTLQGWVGEDYPIMFDCPDYYLQGALGFPHEWNARTRDHPPRWQAAAAQAVTNASKIARCSYASAITRHIISVAADQESTSA
jgi:hypothetical protein